MPAGTLLFHPCIGPRSGAPALDTGPQAEAGAVRMAPADVPLGSLVNLTVERKNAWWAGTPRMGLP